MEFEKLFARWQKAHPFECFVKDGIVDPGRCERPRVLFVLRDMNCDKTADLREHLRGWESGWRTWCNVGRWTKALLDGEEEYPRDMSKWKRVEQMHRIAAMNLKKEGGGPRTVGGELQEAVESQRDLIWEEICLCDPDIIICCGLRSPGITDNATLLRDHVLPETTEPEWLKSASFDRWWMHYHAAINGRQVPVVGFCHPQVTNFCGCRGHKDLFEPLYRDMLMIRRRFLQKKGNGSENEE